MNLLKNILIDSLNGFAFDDILFFIIQLLIASVLGHFFQIIWNKKHNNSILKNAALYAVLFALLTVFAKHSVSFSIIGLAMVIWASKEESKINFPMLPRLIIGLIGVGVGSQNVLLTIFGITLVSIIIIFSSIDQNDESSK